MVTRHTRTLTLEQVTRLFKAAQRDPLEAFVCLALTGLRHGEMLALQWSDIDFEQGSLQIRRTVISLGSMSLVRPPKTKESWCTVTLPPFVIKSLLRHRKNQQETRARTGVQWQNQDLVFCTPTGDFLTHTSNLDSFHSLLRVADLPLIRIHDLRHIAGVWMRAMQQ